VQHHLKKALTCPLLTTQG